MIASQKQHKKDKQELAAQLLKTLSHPVRLQIIQSLGRHGQLSATTIQRPLSLSLAGLSHHLIKMTNRQILKRSRRGRETYYCLTNPHLIDMLNDLFQFIDETN